MTRSCLIQLFKPTRFGWLRTDIKRTCDIYIERDSAYFPPCLHCYSHIPAILLRLDPIGESSSWLGLFLRCWAWAGPPHGLAWSGFARLPHFPEAAGRRCRAAATASCSEGEGWRRRDAVRERDEDDETCERHERDGEWGEGKENYTRPVLKGLALRSITST